MGLQDDSLNRLEWENAPFDAPFARRRVAAEAAAAVSTERHATRTPGARSEMRRARERRGVVLDFEERALVARLLAGDEAACESFVDDYVPRLHRYAASRLAGERDLVQEVVQATVCRAIEKLSGFRGESSLFTWLCACCHNEIVSVFRRRSRRPATVPIEEALATAGVAGDSPADPERSFRRAETRALVHLALDRLPAHQARALEWKYLEGLSVREIAQRSELGEKAAESLLTRARIAFRAAFEELTLAGEVVARARGAEHD